MAETVPTATCPFCQSAVEPSTPSPAGDNGKLRGTDAECEQCRETFAVYYY